VAARIAIMGPTASGKSELAVRLADRLGGEVINADSMQLYRGMDIGTAKLTRTERRGVPHHLLDVLDVTEPASVAAYQRAAVIAVEEIERRGHVPIVVGGSGLYVAAVVDTLAFPGTDAAVRGRWEQELAAHGPVALHARLAEVDPAAALRILPTNGRRIVRALEVVEIAGTFPAELPALGADGGGGWLRIGLDVPRDVLDARVAARVSRMWELGLVDEVRGLADRGLRAGRTASRALGYRQVLDLVDGRISEPEAQVRTVNATRRYVRRQESWFRRDAAIRWIRWIQPDGAADVRDVLDLVGAAER
jgi:tRNA dimethylallyltransferase